MSFHQQLSYKTANRDAVLQRMVTVRAAGNKVVFTNGCFDILHPGHVDYLCRARDLGGFLVVGLNTDHSVQLLSKGPNRPVNRQDARATVLAGLACVDAVVLFNEATPLELITFLKPDVLAKGNDYAIENIVGADVVRANGGTVTTIPFLEGYSTTALIKKITG